jgi:alkanesulfonate monooxygenase SsuD/methylene tetrahydromethanopterin reductase-like flavin-dependent oxidoreductase (luciferase family)
MAGVSGKSRMAELGRSREHMKILPACFVVVGDTVEEARAKRAKLDSLVDYANAIASLSIVLGTTRQNLIPTSRCRTISPKATLRRVAVSWRSTLPSVRI